MIELRNIEKAFGEKQLFNGYNAAIPEASLTIISGDSGDGGDSDIRIPPCYCH